MLTPRPDRSLTGEEEENQTGRRVKHPDLLRCDVLGARTCVTHSRTSSPHFMVCGVPMDGCAAAPPPVGGERRTPPRAHAQARAR